MSSSVQDLIALLSGECQPGPAVCRSASAALPTVVRLLCAGLPPVDRIQLGGVLAGLALAAGADQPPSDERSGPQALPADQPADPAADQLTADQPCRCGRPFPWDRFDYDSAPPFGYFCECEREWRWLGRGRARLASAPPPAPEARP